MNPADTPDPLPLRLSPTFSSQPLETRHQELVSAYTDLQSAFEKLKIDYEKASAALTTTRQRSFVHSRIDLLWGQIDSGKDLTAVQKGFEDLTVAYWMLTKDQDQQNQYLLQYVKSILKESNSPVVTVDGETQELISTAAKLLKAANDAMFSVKVCARTVNRLSRTISSFYSVDLPLVGKHPEIEVPEVCESIVRAVALIGTPREELGSVRKSFQRARLRTEVFSDMTRETDWELEEMTFYRDLYRKQGKVLKEMYTGRRRERSEMEVLQLINAKENTIQSELDKLLKAKQEFIKLQAESHCYTPFEVSQDPFSTLETASKTTSSHFSSARTSPRYRVSPFVFSPPLRSPRAGLSTEKLLESARAKLEAIEREWKEKSRSRLIQSMSERKISLSPRSSVKRLTSLYIPTSPRTSDLPDDGSAPESRAFDRQGRYRQPTTKYLRTSQSKTIPLAL